MFRKIGLGSGKIDISDLLGYEASDCCDFVFTPSVIRIECSPFNPLFISEFVFICKVFAGLAAGLSGAGLVLHVLYIPLRVQLIRQIAIYLLGAAGSKLSQIFVLKYGCLLCPPSA